MYQSDINLNLYKIFYEVATCESISRAAKKLIITQSAVSKAIKKLEEDLDTSLFYRTTKGVKLTEKGEELLFYVKEAFNNLITAERTMVENNNLTKGKIAIGVPSQIGSFYIFEDITNFHKEYPNIEITIISKTTTQLLKLLEQHEIDFIIDTSPINTKNSDIVIKPLMEVENCFVVNANSSLKYLDIKSVKDLENYPLVLPISGTNNRRELDVVFDKYNTMVSDVINIHTSEMIVGAVKKDLGIGYIIKDVVRDNLLNKDFILVYIERYLTMVPRYFIENYLHIEIK